MTQKKKAKILLIEDDDAIREMYMMKFHKAGIFVHTAKDGVEGLALGRDIKPNILLLDIKVPFITGDKILRELLMEPWAKKMRIIVMTNINKREAPDILKTDRINKYIVKAHFTPTEVLALVKKELENINYELPPQFGTI